jgi:hypothetical protein
MFRWFHWINRFWQEKIANIYFCRENILNILTLTSGGECSPVHSSSRKRVLQPEDPEDRGAEEAEAAQGLDSKRLS